LTGNFSDEDRRYRLDILVRQRISAEAALRKATAQLIEELAGARRQDQKPLADRAEQRLAELLDRLSA
jgi:hypothetical protein